jgi:hypothetical protein
MLDGGNKFDGYHRVCVEQVTPNGVDDDAKRFSRYR